MGPPAVVVVGVGPKRVIEVSSTEDERPVEALGPDRAEDHPRPFRADDRIERSAELRISIVDEEPDGG